MLFIPVLIVGILLYIIGHRVSSVLIFFFFCLDGFQLIPESLFNTYMGISKGIDFAFIYTILLFLFGLIRYDDFIPNNPLTKVIFGYLVLLFLCIGVSFFYYGIPLVEIIRTSRSFLLVLSYFLLRRLDETQFRKVMYALLYITVFQCILFFFQAILGVPILVNAISGGSLGPIRRYYNFPKLLYIFTFIALFTPLLTRKQKIWMIPLLLLGIVLPLSRSAVLIFLFLLFIGFLIKIKKSKHLLKLIPVFLVAVVATGAIVATQIQGRTLNDIQSVMGGEFVDIVETVEEGSDPNAEIDESSTMIFRMALLFERFLDVIDSDMAIALGKGLSVEHSPYTNANFQYMIGLQERAKENHGSIIQLHSPDISWSNLILRYGIGGTIVYVIGFFYLSIVIIRQKSIFSTPLFLLSCFILLNSFSSDVLFTIVTFLPYFLFFDQTYYQRQTVYSTCSKSPAQTC